MLAVTGHQDSAEQPPGEHGQDRAAEIARLAPDAIAGAVSVAGGYYIGGYDGAVIGAASMPYLALVLRQSALFVGDRVRRINEALRAAAEDLGLTAEEFAEFSTRSERARFLTDEAMKAAEATDWPAGVRAIGRALAAGLREPDEALSIPRLVLPAMTELTQAHALLLNLLVMARTWPADRSEPEWVDDHPQLGSTPSEWPAGYIKAALPDLEPVLPALIGTLERHGMIERVDGIVDALDKFAGQVEQTLYRRPQMSQRILRADIDRSIPPPTWSPTDLGKQVIGFYEIAGKQRG